MLKEETVRYVARKKGRRIVVHPMNFLEAKENRERLDVRPMSYHEVNESRERPATVARTMHQETRDKERVPFDQLLLQHGRVMQESFPARMERTVDVLQQRW